MFNYNLIISKIGKIFIIVLLFLILISAYVYTSGIRFGLPCQALNNLYFTNKDSIQTTIEKIKGYPPEATWKGMRVHLAYHPEEAEKKAPRNLYNSIRSYHPDEYYLIKSLSTMNPKKLNFNPNQFVVGGVYLYIIGFLLFLLSKFNLIIVTSDLAFYFLHPEEIAKFYLVGRFVTALYGSSIIVLSYFIFKKVFKNNIGSFISSLLILFTPLILLNAHYMYVDVPGLFWIMACLFVTTKFIEKFSFKKVFLAGLFSGLACGTKVTFCTALIIPIIGILLSYKDLKQMFKGFALTIAVFLLFFFITNPYFFITLPKPLVALSENTGLSFSLRPYISNLKYGLGVPLFVFNLIGILIKLCLFGENKLFEKKAVLLFLFWVLFFFVFISSFSITVSRYILPIVPSLIILGCSGWFELLNKLKLTKKHIGYSIIIFVLLFTFCYGMSYEKLLVDKNIRTEAGEWILKNIKESSTIGMTEIPWQHQIPPVDENRYKLVIVGNDYSMLQKKKPEYFITSNIQYGLSYNIEEIKKGMLPRGFFHNLFTSQDYEICKVFYKPLSFMGIRFSQFGASEDIWYINPIIVVLKYKGL
ncbi:glycosyltransferase family 39 protein [bacterium]|nr:glycosyltransferase family 39 protein [bacterium]